MFCIHELFLMEYFPPLCPISNFRSVIPRKKFKKVCYHVRDRTGLHFLTFFQVAGKWVSQSDSFFFLLNTNSKASFSYHIQLPEILCQKYKKFHKYKYISIAISLCLMKIFNIFWTHKVYRTLVFDIRWNS